MSFGYATQKNVSSKIDNSIVDWIRPSDWLPLTPIGLTEQKITGLYAIWPDDKRNLVALLCTGAYTVDWGDGVVENYNTSALASHQYTYADIPSGTTTSEGFRQVIITVTPQAGQNLVTFNLRQRPNGVTVGGFATNWLDLEFGSPTLTSGIIGANNSQASFGLLKRLRFASKAAGYTTFTDFLYLLYNLEECVIDANMSNALGLNAFFYSCFSLKKAPYFDTSSATTATNFFGLCRSLISVPNYNFQSLTNASNMFDGCSSLPKISFQNFSNVTNMTSAFLNCSDLVTVPVINCSNNANLSNAFSGCSNLKEITILNCDKVTNFNNTFTNCSSLEKVIIDTTTGNATGTASMFNNCYVLEEAPLFDTSKITSMASMFLGCRNLKTVPEYNTANCTNFSQTFSGCNILESIPVLNTSNSTNFSSMFADCTLLTEAPNIDTIKATTVASMFAGCRTLVTLPAYNLSNNTTGGSTILGAPGGTSTINLVNIDVFGSKFGINIGQGFLGNTELTTFMDNLGIAGAASQTVTITGNYGADTIQSKTAVLTLYSRTLTGIGTTGLTVGMYGTGTGVTTAITVSCNATTDRLSNPANSGWAPPEGTRVSVTTTANGLTAYKIYYTRNVDGSGNFQLSETIDGSIVDITGTSNLTMNYENQIESINAGASTVTMKLPVSGSGTQTISFRSLNTNIARLKNYTVTG